MSDFANVTSSFAENYSSIGEVTSVMHPTFYPDPLAETVVGQEVARSVVWENLEVRGESNDEEEMIDVVEGAEAGVTSGAESESFTLVDALRHSNLIAASDTETTIHTSGMPTCTYHLKDNLQLFFDVNT